MASAGAIEPDRPPTYRGGAGEPLVLIHGGGGTRRLWRTTIPLLEPHHDVLAVTLTGHFGGRELPASVEPSIQALVEGVEADMDEAGVGTAHLAGGSLGGWVALELARRGRARSVVAIAPGGGWEQGSREVRLVAWIYRFLTAGSRLFARHARALASRPRLRRLLTWHHFAHAERMSPDDFAYMIAGAAGMSGFSEAIAAFVRNPGAEHLDQIRCPVLLAFPEKDHILPRRRYGERIVRQIAHAEVVDLPGVGHAAMVDDPELVARTILDFTSRHAEAGAARLNTPDPHTKERA
jgi:pimeloyl-ACP methyl ester carboxylesterase